MFSDRLLDYDLILASGSLRRLQLMEEAGFRFRVAALSYNESHPAGMDPHTIAAFIASGKSDAWSEPLLPRQVLITADTTVLLDGELLGKPDGAAEAESFLRQLSGRSHEVITAVCLRDSSRKHLFQVSTAVTFRELTDEEISYYVSHYRPFDKAGAYGIQEWIGVRGITRIEGSYHNVMGLPVSRLCTELMMFTDNQTNTI